VPFFIFYFLCRFLRSLFCAGTFLSFKKRHIYFGSWPRRISVQFFFFPAGPVRAFQLPGNKPTNGEKACFPDGKQQAHRGRKMQQNV
jgi:hypothetical protein